MVARSLTHSSRIAAYYVYDSTAWKIRRIEAIGKWFSARREFYNV